MQAGHEGHASEEAEYSLEKEEFGGPVSDFYPSSIFWKRGGLSLNSLGQKCHGLSVWWVLVIHEANVTGNESTRSNRLHLNVSCFLIILFIGYAGSLLLCGLFSSCSEQRLLFDYNVCGLLIAVASLVVEHGL